MTGVQSAKHKSAVTSGAATATPSAPAAPARATASHAAAASSSRESTTSPCTWLSVKQPSTPKARGVQEERTVLSHGHRVVFHMIAQIETVVRGLAHPALTAREAQAHACGRKQGLVG